MQNRRHAATKHAHPHQGIIFIPVGDDDDDKLSSARVKFQSNAYGVVGSSVESGDSSGGASC